MPNNSPEKKLSRKEEEIMTCFWKNGAMFIREVLESLPDPKPHVNTVSTFVRLLEAKGWLNREQIGNSYRYSAAVPLTYFRENSLKGLVDRYFNKSYFSFVSTLVEEEKISASELRELLEKIENGKAK